jgi:hypothetical protein
MAACATQQVCRHKSILCAGTALARQATLKIPLLLVDRHVCKKPNSSPGENRNIRQPARPLSSIITQGELFTFTSCPTESARRVSCKKAYCRSGASPRFAPGGALLQDCVRTSPTVNSTSILKCSIHPVNHGAKPACSAGFMQLSG